MSPEIYAQWMQKLGNRVVSTVSSLWLCEGSRVYQAFPYHQLINPGEDELRGLLKKEKAIALRYSSPPESLPGVPSHHIVYRGNDFDFDALGHRTRKNVRKGLRSCQVQTIDPGIVLRDGWDIHMETIARQGRVPRLGRSMWRKRLSLAAELPGFEFWGATVGKTLVAWMLIFQMNECSYILDQYCKNDALNKNVNNAMTFVVTQEVIRRGKSSMIFYGMESIDAPASVSAFKFHMGYEPLPVRQRVLFHPYVSPFVNRVSHSILKAFSGVARASRHLSKAEGLARFSIGERHKSLLMSRIPPDPEHSSVS